MKQPIKYAKKELVKYGAQIVLEGDRQVVFEMPNGGRYTVGVKTPMANLRRVVDDLHERFNPLRGYEASPMPDYEESRVMATSHFLKRFELMSEQEQLTDGEIAAALRAPEHVWVSRSRQRYAFERGRVIVIAQVSQGRAVLVTALWATEALWVRNPRTEDE